MRCLAGMCHAPSPPHHRLLPRANSCRALFPNPRLPPWAIAHLTPTHSPSSPYSLSITLPTHIPLLSRLTFHPFVVSTPAFSNSSHVSFRGVRTKTFSAHNTTKIAPVVRETWLFTHGRASLNFTIIPMFTSDVAMPCPCGA